MSESLLKREFKEKDINRIRNIVSKKYGNSVSSQIGYVKKEEERKEGDVWEENDKTWTIKNGLKQSYTKLDDIKKTIRVPLICPTCKSRMKSSIDKKMYHIHEECATCVAKKESELKFKGQYQDYVKSFVNKNMETYLDEAEQFMMEYAESIASRYVTEDGDIEETSGVVDKETLIQKWKDEMNEMREQIKNS